LTDSPEIALEITGTLHPFGLARGHLSEMRCWLDGTLAAAPPAPTMERIRALFGAARIAGIQGDLPTATARVAEGQTLVEQMTDPLAHGMISFADGLTALVSGEFDRACARFEDSLSVCNEASVQVAAMLALGWALEFRGEIGRALIWQEKALAISESHGESVNRGYALWAIGVGWWRRGEPDRAEQLLKDGVRVTHQVDDARQSAACLEALAWLSGQKHHPRRAVVLMAAAEALVRTIGASTMVLPHLNVFHEECERSARDALGSDAFEAAHQEGRASTFDEAVAYAIGGTT
jgi:non-specific serine/threonine protein kinase